MSNVVRASMASLLLFALPGCGDDSAGSGGGTATAATTTGAGTGGAPAAGWIAGECGVCFTEKCAAPITACDGDPGCATTYACLAACAADPVDGPARQDCAAACAAPDSSTARAAYETVEACRTTGDGFNACPSCQPEVEQPRCEPAQPPSSCTLCLESECCEWIGKYRLNPEAQALSGCAGECPDEGFADCFLECADQHPDGVDDWGTTFGCVAIHCLGEEKCGDAGEPIDPCAQCLADDCAEQSFACDSVPACVLHSYCFDACDGDVDCSRACNDEYPDAVDLFNALAACTLSRCEGVCGD